MVSIGSLAKDILLNYPAKALPGWIYLKLIVIYSWLFRLVGNKNALKWATVDKSTGLVFLKFFDESEWRLVNPIRSNRYLKGISHAGDRLRKRYRLDLIEELPSTFVDVGANVGELSYWYAKRGCHVMAFEPDPIIYNLLKINLKDFENVEFSKDALSNVNTKSKLSVRSDSADSSLIFGEEERDFVIVNAVRFEDHVFSRALKSPVYLKMDTEGNEPESLLGFGKKLSNIDFVAIDAGPERLGEPTRDEVENVLKEAGLKLEDRSSNFVVNAYR